MEYLMLVAALLVGWFFLWVFYKVIVSGRVNSYSRVQDLESKYSTAQAKRTAEKIAILEQIGGPELKSGRYSEWQVQLWNEYNRLNEIDEALTVRERTEIVNAETVIDEKTQFELENGINPYSKSVKHPRAVLREKRAR